MILRKKKEQEQEQEQEEEGEQKLRVVAHSPTQGGMTWIY